MTPEPPTAPAAGRGLRAGRTRGRGGGKGRKVLWRGESPAPGPGPGTGRGGGASLRGARGRRGGVGKRRRRGAAAAGRAAVRRAPWLLLWHFLGTGSGWEPSRRTRRGECALPRLAVYGGRGGIVFCSRRRVFWNSRRRRSRG